MSRYYSVLVITVVVINGLHCNHLNECARAFLEALTEQTEVIYIGL